MSPGMRLAAALALSALAAGPARGHSPAPYGQPEAGGPIDPRQAFPYAVLSGAGGHFHGLVVSSAGGPLLASTHIGLFRSDDRGATWRLLERRFSGVAVRAVVRHPRTGALFVATRELGLIESRDGGRRWRTLGSLPGRDVRALAVEPSAKGVVYAWVADGGLFRTEDHGARWARVAGPDALPEVASLAVHPTDPSRLYAGTTKGVWVGGDRGRTWRVPSDGLGGSTGAVSVPPWAPDVLLAATADGGFAGGADGRAWRAMPAHPAWWGPLTAFAFLEERPGVVFAVTHEGVVAERPLAGGGEWTPLATPTTGPATALPARARP